MGTPFPEFYDNALAAALAIHGRPTREFFETLAGYPGLNAKHYKKLAQKDWLAGVEGARDIEPCALSHPKVKSHFLRYYGPTAYNLHYIEVHARASKSLTPEMIAKAEEHVDQVIEKATKEVEQNTAAAAQILRDNAVTQSVSYGAGPLLVPVEIVSPYCGSYLTLIIKADHLLGLLEYQRLRRYITNNACDLEFARIDRLLKGVARSAFELQRGLRARVDGRSAKEAPQAAVGEAPAKNGNAKQGIEGVAVKAPAAEVAPSAPPHPQPSQATVAGQIH